MGVTRYRCIAADPPWMERGGGKIKRGADRHYALLKPAQIVTVMRETGQFTGDSPCHLWMWCTDNHLTHGLEVMRAVGFRYVRLLVWHKEGNIGLGQYLRGAHEVCLFGVRGRLPAESRAQPSAFAARRGRHSEKPARAYEIIEAVSPGPRLELFARAPRPGWSTQGLELQEGV